MLIPIILTLNAIILLFVILLCWGYSTRIKDVSFIDAVWPMGMVVMTFSSWFHSYNQDYFAIAIYMLTAIWGLRLGWHLFTRWREFGEDPRYTKIMAHSMESKGWSWNKTALLKVFLLQAPLLYIVCLPAQIAIIAGNSQSGSSIFAILGIIIALIGLGFEVVGDAQLKAFRANPDNKGKVLNSGLWRYTRHPNYFGDACFWWGIWVAQFALTTPMLALATIIGPIFLNFTLVKWSGAALLERGMAKTRPGYDEYIAKTSRFFPLPPKK
ncbi:hypothetical protein LPB140_05420 [Sphingorhabdus lutea]|uniref:Uncharacterized protein n=1 Tax=Sphingorhabdus lutea TaxID=1913578 RepID=A0A1L3JB28_9SPHN|nr:DUF1295 domain-containing protein [Sphingorhabdus lutea]APG62331.1 hypothetical protein LPB140_05420 [Sphingorhabdus lutea]